MAKAMSRVAHSIRCFMSMRLAHGIVADVAGGILSFDVVHSQNNESTTGANAITLDQKLYVATHSIGDNAIAGFAHGGDFYVIATGANGDSTTDDIVVKLNGVAGVTDISTILA